MNQEPESTTNRKSFCILPWVHLQLDPDGSVAPCCRASGDLPLGSVRTDPPSEVWNGATLRKMRLELLAGGMPVPCTDCNRREGWGEQSLRLQSNERFRDYFSRVDQTRVDGSVPTEGPVYLGLRFSNLCNFKCRSCGTGFSSSWEQEMSALQGRERMPVTRAFASSRDAETWFGALLPSLQHVYFAGGEPLLDEHHYLFLEALLAAKRSDVELVYNTNFSTLSHRGWDATELWSHFEHVSVMASLDGAGEQAELLRKGMRWSEIEKNFRRLREAAPRVRFQVFPTVSAMNAFHLPQAISRWIDLGMIREAGDLFVNTLTAPAYLCTRVFNGKEREMLAETYREFIEEKTPQLSPELRNHLLTELDKVLATLRESFDPDARLLFREAMFSLDSIRDERMISLFPELFGLLYEK